MSQRLPVPLSSAGHRKSNRLGMQAAAAEPLSTTGARLIASHISDHSRSTYAAGMQRFGQYCAGKRIDPLHNAPTHIVNFVGFLFDDGVTLSTARVHVAAVNNFFLENGIRSPTATELVTNALKGYARLNPKQTDSRLPITHAVMCHIHRQTRSAAGNDHDGKVLWSAFTLAFFGFLRIS